MNIQILINLILISVFFFVNPLSAQEKIEINDPTINRMFIMPTGNILPEGTLSIYFTDVAYVNVGYSPFIFLQTNFSGIIPFGDLIENKPVNNNLSLSVKSEILNNQWILKGLSVGGEIMYSGIKDEKYYYGLQLENTEYFYSGIVDDVFQLNYVRETPFIGSCNIAVTLGTNGFRVHANAAKLFFQTDKYFNHYGFYRDYESENQSPPIPFLSYLQFGIEYDLSWMQENRGIKFISEVFYNKLNPDYNLIVSGFRFYSNNNSVDLAMAYSGVKMIRGYEGIVPVISFNFFY